MVDQVFGIVAFFKATRHFPCLLMIYKVIRLERKTTLCIDCQEFLAPVSLAMLGALLTPLRFTM